MSLVSAIRVTNCLGREGRNLLIEGLHFPTDRLVQDRKQREVWRLGSGTVIEFIPRQPVQNL